MLTSTRGTTAKRICATLFGALLALSACSHSRPKARPHAAMPSPPSSSVSSRPVVSGWPGSANTGVPAGTVLSAYTGPMTITQCGTVISDKTINGDITIAVSNHTSSPSTPCVTIRDSLIHGTVNAGSTPGATGPLVMTSVEVAAPTTSIQSSVVGTNYYLWQVNVHGGARGAIQCAGNCAIHDSWTHDFYLAGATHYDGIISNGTNGDPLLIDHNTIECNFYASAPGATGACSADIGLFGDFSAITNVTITNNLLVGTNYPSYCLYGGATPTKAYPTPHNVTVTGNTFQHGPTGKCASYGPVAAWAPGNGNTWTHNTWDHGRPVTP
jgi:hypothetical protein